MSKTIPIKQSASSAHNNAAAAGLQDLTLNSPPVSSSYRSTFMNSPPSASFNAGSPIGSDGRPYLSHRSRTASVSSRPLKPFTQEKSADRTIKILLLENISASAVKILQKETKEEKNDLKHDVTAFKSAMSEEELIEKIKDVDVIGIRSKTKLTKKVLQAAKRLTVIGCFCIGTNQVDLKTAAELGIAVFNSPFANSRSVAELVIAEIVLLARQLGDRNNELHNGVWNKVSAKCWEIRGKTLGIVGYGHIGSQLSVLAEAMGMSVLYYDVVNIMGLGNTKQVGTLHDLLHKADFVTLHVPELPETRNMISTAEFAAMRSGTYLINASRGSVIDIPAFIEASQSGKLAGGALDVYPNEPASNGPFFDNTLNPWTEDLRSCKNIILSPHIGGSTEEAQEKIGIEVATALTNYINEGSSVGSVNFPEVALRQLTVEEKNHVRVLFVHHNRAGALRAVNDIFSTYNIKAQFSDSAGDIAYLIADIGDVSEHSLDDLESRLNSSEFSIKTRILH